MEEDYPYRPCVRSGLCCKTGPCNFGEWDEQKHECKFLEVDEKHGDIEIYRCGKFAEISTHSQSKVNPAFGAGCCMPLFNTARQTIIRSITERRISLVILNSNGSPIRVPIGGCVVPGPLPSKTDSD